MLEKHSVMQKSDDLVRSSDFLIENQHSPFLEQSNSTLKQNKTQSISHKKIDLEEHKKAEIDLENDISSLGIINQSELNVFLLKKFPNNSKAKSLAQDFFDEQNILGNTLTNKQLEKYLSNILLEDKELSNEDRIKNVKKELVEQGKSQTEILLILISKFENEESVSTWVENWRNFQKLNTFAESKPSGERKAIQNIIYKADFTSENAFSTSLTEIAQSNEISDETKFQISREFNGANVFSTDDLNYGLKQQETRKNEIETVINQQNDKKESLGSEIENLEEKLEKLPLNDPKRKDLETEIEQKKEVLENTKAQIKSLDKAKPDNVSFQLRNGFSAKLNNDGTRSIKFNSADFEIKLPSNFLPFTDTKNLRSINLSFPYLALKNQNIANIIFSPNLENNSVPTKRNRDMSHLILTSLKIDDSQILSENNIAQLNKDLSRLTSIQNGKSAQDKLIDLGIFNIDSQSLDKSKFRDILKIIHENRSLDDDLFLEKMEKI